MHFLLDLGDNRWGERLIGWRKSALFGQEENEETKQPRERERNNIGQPLNVRF